MVIASGPGRATARPIGRRAHGSAERLRATAFAQAVEPVLAAVQVSGLVANAEIAAELNARSVPAEDGGGWTPQRVAGVRRCLEVLNGEPPARCTSSWPSGSSARSSRRPTRAPSSAARRPTPS